MKRDSSLRCFSGARPLKCCLNRALNVSYSCSSAWCWACPLLLAKRGRPVSRASSSSEDAPSMWLHLSYDRAACGWR
eukprot:scaffold8646_cov115-Isochrysis_galbana.AAC.8